MRETFVVRHRHLPHWDVPGGSYFVTTCLDGSIPAQGLLDLAKYVKELASRSRPEHVSPAEHERNLRKLHFARMDGWLDRQPASRHLENPALAQLVVDSLFYFAGVRYDLFAYCVMPSHYHWVFRPIDAWVASIDTLLGEKVRTARERIGHSVNTYTAGKCNGLLNRHGAFWQHESYEHWIRDADEFNRIMEYIEMNPVKAGLVARPEEWRFSSAFLRAQAKLPPGIPLMKPVG